MRLSLFESFTDMIEGIPVGAVLRTLEREQRMLEEDLAFKRPVPVREAESIINFCRFVEAVRADLPARVFIILLPPQHLDLYRRTLERLIDGRELPPVAANEFDCVTPRKEPAKPQLTAALCEIA
ncbi:MAG TPA: hypothetical protein VG347_00155 [Verrucomicrobiae bacterium]|nr:hypothetical protein [Verrucomicrobiae bacterium]